MKGASSRYCDSAIDVDNSLSIMVQVMVYGNWGSNSYAGNYYTRNIITGDPEIQGEFGQNEFDIEAGKAKDISKIEKKHFTHFTDIARKVEDNFKEIREIKFTIEEGDFWLVEQKEVDDKSTQSQIKALLDLTKRKDRFRAIHDREDQAEPAQRASSPGHRSPDDQGNQVHQGRHRRIHRRRHRPRVFLDTQAARRAQAGDHEGRRHQSHPGHAGLLRRGCQGDRGGPGRYHLRRRLLVPRAGRRAEPWQGRHGSARHENTGKQLHPRREDRSARAIMYR